MTATSWLRTLLGREARPLTPAARAPHRPHPRLALEGLEDRLVPAIDRQKNSKNSAPRAEALSSGCLMGECTAMGPRDGP